MSVQVGSDPTNTAARYSCVYNAHSDVVNLVDASGNVVASYAYDTWGNLTSASETIPNANGWTNPYRYDGRDGVRYDASDGLYWMRVRAYDPTIGRFISHDPLGRAPLFFSDQPYAYAGNNPVSNVDPSGQYRAAGNGSTTHESWKQTKRHMARIAKKRGCDKVCKDRIHQEWVAYHVGRAKAIAKKANAYFSNVAKSAFLNAFGAFFLSTDLAFALHGTEVASGIIELLDTFIKAELRQFDGFNIFEIASAVVTLAEVAYGIVAEVAAWIFSSQASQSDAFWLNSANLSGEAGWFGLTVALLGTLLTVLALILAAVPATEGLSWVVGALAIGFDLALFQIVPRVDNYIDQEDQEFGYEPY